MRTRGTEEIGGTERRDAGAKGKEESAEGWEETGSDGKRDVETGQQHCCSRPLEGLLYCCPQAK